MDRCEGEGVVAAERGRRGEGQFIDRPGTGGTKIQDKILYNNQITTS